MRQGMKVLVICQYYYPEPFRIKDICEEMARRGHEVTVVAGVPNYPEGITYKGYEKGKQRDEVINGVRVHRCFTIPRKTGAIHRFLNYYSYALSAGRYVRSKNCAASGGSEFDVIFVNQLSPVMMGEAAVAYKKKYHVPAVMYCLDLWPESLIAGGISRGSFIYRYFHHVSKKIYRRMDKILITSRMFSDYLENEFEICEDKIEYLPQYAEDIFEQIPAKEENGTFDFVFAGNIGVVQSVETVIKAAEILKNEYSNIRWHIVGGGTDLERLKQLAFDKKLDNVIFYGRRPLDEMPEFYKMADAMLVTLKADPLLSLTLPGKVQSYMAAGKPIIGAIDGETALVIEAAQCGYCGKAEDGKALAENVKLFINSKDKKDMGANGRVFYEEHFAQEMFKDKLEKELATAAGIKT